MTKFKKLLPGLVAGLFVALSVSAGTYVIEGTIISSPNEEVLGAMTSSFWNSVGTYIKTVSPTGYDILINGTSKYLNFNTTSGSSGYGFRDNAGTMEVKNSGGSWAGVGSGDSGASSTLLSDNNIFSGSNTFNGINPTANNGSDLGAFGNAWKDIYASGTLRASSTILGGRGYHSTTTPDETLTLNANNRISLSTDQLWTYATGHQSDLIRLNWLTNTAKPAITWYDATTTPAIAEAAIVAHQFLSDGSNSHQHISIETNDGTGALQSRFEIPWGCTTCEIATVSQSNFTVAEGELRIAYDNSANKSLVFQNAKAVATSTRWSVRTDNTTESGSNVGSDFKIVRFNDSGSALDSPLFIKRSNGRIGMGTSTPNQVLDVVGNGIFEAFGTTSVIVRRETTAQFATFELDTASTAQWSMQLRNDGTNNLQFRDGINGKSVLTLKQGTTPLSAFLSTVVIGNGTASTTFSGGGNIYASGDISASGTSYLAHTVPSANNAFDLGSPTSSWRNIYASGTLNGVPINGVYPAFTYMTSTAWSGTTTIPLGPAFNAETWNNVKCFTDAGTLNVTFNDGTNYMPSLNASTTVGNFVLSSNNTFTESEKRYVSVGTPATSPSQISCTVYKTIQ